MKIRTKNLLLISLAGIMAGSLCFGLASLKNTTQVDAAEFDFNLNADFAGAYRNRLAYSARRGWNNDPNGLLYANGTWHMYYQYNYDKNSNKTWTGWGNMSWGHATSTDLVHWTEQPVAIPAHTLPKDDASIVYDAAFSGSAVYDENNTSGLFETGSDGKVKEGHGIVAVFTEPSENQHQVLAYSKDNGQSFTLKKVILPADGDWSNNDGEFRDPKVFRCEELNKWLLIVGGGEARMFASDNLLDWTFIGGTGFWGECPDLSRYEVNGKTKYVLAISPEDKENSHRYNKTDRYDTYYPTEYYIVGELDENGLFHADEGAEFTKMHEGIDCYAIQTWNNSPDGKVYALSWGASWKADFENIRGTYNGGMSIVTELGLVEENGKYVLTRNPIKGFETLRNGALKTVDGTVKAGENALAGVKADVADIEAELDFTGSLATEAELDLRVSEAERIKITYDVPTETLTVDRSESSLNVKDRELFAVPYSKKVPLDGGKLSLRILLDRGFINLFADGGKSSFFSVVFPSASSNGMVLTGDGDYKAKVNVYKMNAIFETAADEEFLVTTNKIDGAVGLTYPVIASSFGKDFDGSKVKYTVTEGASNIRLEQHNEFAYITLLQKGTNDKFGHSAVKVSYPGKGEQTINLYIYGNGYVSDVDFNRRSLNSGFGYIGDNGFHLESDGDGFRFSDSYAKDMVYSAEFTPEAGSAAAALVFGASSNYTSYWCATADFGGAVKIWRLGVGEGQGSSVVGEKSYPMIRDRKFKLTLIVCGDTANVFVNDDTTAALTCKLEGYRGGLVGVNVFNGKFDINNVTLHDLVTPEGGLYVGSSKVTKVESVTDSNKALTAEQYSVKGGVLSLAPAYVETLKVGTKYTFKATTSRGEYTWEYTKKAAASSAASVKALAELSAFYCDDEVAILLDTAAAVSKLTVDGKDVAFKQDGTRIVIAAEIVKELSLGKHTVKLTTDKGECTVEAVLIATTK